MIRKLFKTQLFFFLLVSSQVTITAQNSFKNEVVDKIAKTNFLFEKVFIHTNKDNYFNEDLVWFQSYVSENNNKPSLLTTVLYVNLLNEKGDVIDTFKSFVKNGVGNGQLYFNDTVISGKYYIQAYTNFMKNYGKSNYFLKEINYVNAKKNSKKNTDVSNKYDVQLFPESGYFIEKENNVIGIKVLKNGKSIDYKGEIKDSQNKTIAQFSNEYLGMCKSNFIHKENEIYQAVFNFKDTIITQKLPKAIKNEVNIQCIVDKEYITINLLGIPSVINNGSKYHLLFHQKNNIINYHEITDLNSNALITIAKNDLNSGVNSITLFKNNIPIAERKVFIYKEDTFTSLDFQNVEKINDSLLFNYKLQTPEKAFLSIGILPNKATNTTTIKSALLLSPYINGYIENPSNYFDHKNVQKESQIDLLMLTQGYVKYEFKKTNETLFEFENGFKLTGKLEVLSSNELALINDKNQLIQKIFLDSKKDFTFYNNAFYNNDEVRISFLKNKSEAVKPKNILLNEVNNDKEVFFNFKPINKYQPKTSINNLENNQEFINSENARILEEVTVQKKLSKDKALDKKYKKYVFDIGAYYKIDVPEHFIKEEETLINFLYRNENVEVKHWGGLDYSLSYNSTKEAVLYVDGKRIDGIALATFKLDLKQVQDIMVQPRPYGNKYYQVFTTDDYKNDIERLYERLIITNGYNYSKKYYAPLYETLYPEESLEIHWIPSVTSSNSKVTLSTPLKSANDIFYFYIEGFTENGKLISEIIPYK